LAVARSAFVRRTSSAQWLAGAGFVVLELGRSEVRGIGEL
jgi:hypothetical protein